MSRESTGFAVESFRGDSIRMGPLRMARNREEDGRNCYAQMADRMRHRAGVISGGRVFAEGEHPRFNSRAHAESPSNAFCEHRGIFGLRRYNVSTYACDYHRAGAAPQGAHRHSTADRSKNSFDVRAVGRPAAAAAIHFLCTVGRITDSHAAPGAGWRAADSQDGSGLGEEISGADWRGARG